MHWEFLHTQIEPHTKAHDEDMCTDETCVNLHDCMAEFARDVPTRTPVNRAKHLLGKHANQFCEKRGCRFNPGCVSGMVRLLLTVRFEERVNDGHSDTQTADTEVTLMRHIVMFTSPTSLS